MSLLDDFKNDWKSVKASAIDTNTSKESKDLITSIMELEREGRTKARIGYISGIAGAIVGFSFVLFYSRSPIILTGIFICIIAMAYFIYQVRKTNIKFDGQGENTIQFLKSAKSKLQSRITLLNKSGWIYVGGMCFGMTIINSQAITGNSFLEISLQYAFPFLLGLVVMFGVIKANKKLQSKKIDPLIGDIELLLKELEA